MTNKQAKEIMLKLKEEITNDFDVLEDEEKEAFNKAIEALEQEPCDECEVGNPCLYCKHEFSQKIEQMREFTEEEAKAYSKALDKIYKPTGFNVFNEPCDDVVSREAVLQAVSEGCFELRGVYGRCEELINALPSVRPQEQTGHWIMDDTEHGHCSICEHKEDLMDGKSSYGWCSNCGAKMVESCEKCLYAEETDGSHCYECVKGESKFEPQTGHWIRVTDKTGHLVWECDKCGWQQRFNTHYCPDCGARMESEDNG